MVPRKKLILFDQVLQYPQHIEKSKHQVTIMSAPTATSVVADKHLDQMMGWGSQTSGGRGKRGYQTQLTRRQQESLKVQTAAQEKQEKAARLAKQANVTDLLRKADQGELDWM